MKNKTILITGGTGTLGKKFITESIKSNSFKEIIAISRDEAKQFYFKEDLINKFGNKIKNNINFKLINISHDVSLLEDIFNKKKIDFVLHTAAQKQVQSAEINPLSAVNSNIIGTYNISRLSGNYNVEKFIHLSTDKATDPINTYGCTKFIADKLIVNNFNNSKTKFSILRYGNVLGSKGSILPFFIMQKKLNMELIVTDRLATRFSITINDAFNYVKYVLNNSRGGEIFIPKMNKIKILNLAKLISKKIKISKLNTNEKLHEKIISTNENNFNIFNHNLFYILTKNDKYKRLEKIKLFDYTSSDAPELDSKDLKKILSDCEIEF
jgi:UDP-N-acetylglucosamine 4,6-dehydratase